MASIDETIDNWFAPVSEFTGSVVFFAIEIKAGETTHSLPLILLWLAAAALFFTVYFGFINIRYFKHAIDILRGRYDEDKPEEGEISRFQALATSLSGTVGLGNIAGVAAAVSVGGPGAVFWMMLMGIFGMSTRFVEISLGVKYRHHPDKDNPEKIYGGPMYYLRDAFDNRGIPYVGHIMAAVFAICCMGGAIGGGNMFQANQAFQQVVNITGGEQSFLIGYGWAFGIGLALLTGLVIIGGIKTIAAVTAKLVPVMGGIYLLAGIVVIALNFQNIPGAFGVIVREALSFEAGLGGFIGALLVGVQRAAFSNEAGLGSGAIVHASARTDQPVSQGFVGMLGPFIDTVIICMVTALVIVITGAYEEGQSIIAQGGSIEGVSLTSRAFAQEISWFPYVLALVVFLFAYSTLLTWSYYGTKAAGYLFGEHDWVELAFKIVFLICIVIGSSASLGNLIGFTDAMILSLAIPNIVGLYLLAPELKRDLKKYLEHIKEKDKSSVGKNVSIET